LKQVVKKESFTSKQYKPNQIRTMPLFWISNSFLTAVAPRPAALDFVFPSIDLDRTPCRIVLDCPDGLPEERKNEQ